MWVMLAGVPGKLKALTDRLTAGRAAKLDHLDADVSSRAPASTALSNAVWTPERAAVLDSIGVKQILRGGFDFGSAESSRVVTISGVSLERSLLLHSFNTQTSAGNLGEAFRETFVSAQIIDATTLRFERKKSGSTSRVEWQLIEFR